MAFLKGIKDQVTIPVTVEIDGDMGKKIRVSFKATYKKPRVQESKQVMEACKKGDMSDEDVINDYLVGWSDMPGADGEDVEFSTDALDEAMGDKDYRSALVDGFLKIALDRKTYELMTSKN